MNFVSIIIKLSKSLLYSFQGLNYAYRKELSFRIEVFYLAVSLPILYFLPMAIIEKVIILSTTLLLLAIETLNTAAELIAERLSPEISSFARHVKDLGSAAVFLTLIASFIQWGIFLWPILS